MTEQEAIKVFGGFKFLPREQKAVDIAIKSLEKQIPIELEKQGRFKVCRCGCEMSTFLMHNRANYCPNCGQAIKWE